MSRSLSMQLAKSFAWLQRHPVMTTLAVMLLSFVLLGNLYQVAASTDYFKEVVAAFLGAILTMVVTGMLLGAQTQNEQLRDSNAEVFKKRVDLYETYLDCAVESLRDRRIDKEEAFRMISLTYKLALFSSEDTHKAATAFLIDRASGDNAVDLGSIVTLFRRDLNLVTSNGDMFEVSIPLDQLQQLYTDGMKGSDLHQRTTSELNRLVNALQARWVDGGWAGFLFTELSAETMGDRTLLNVESPLEMVLEADYDIETGEVSLDVIVDAAGLPPRLRGRVLKFARARAQDQFEGIGDTDVLHRVLWNLSDAPQAGDDTHPQNTLTPGELADALREMAEMTRSAARSPGRIVSTAE